MAEILRTGVMITPGEHAALRVAKDDHANYKTVSQQVVLAASQDAVPISKPVLLPKHDPPPK
jgi:hypothetical protein